MNVCGSHSKTFLPLAVGFCDSRTKFLFVRPIAFPIRRQFFDQQKPGVVARLRVFRARISQAHDEKNIFHARGKRLSPQKLFLLLGLGFRLGLGFFVAGSGGFRIALGRGFFAGFRGRAFRAFFFLFFGHLDIARGRSGVGGGHFFLGARRGDGDDGDMFVTQNFHAFRRLDVAQVNGLADFQRGHVQRRSVPANLSAGSEP